MNQIDQLKPLITRLNKIGVNILVSGNWPWIYLDSVNGNKILPEDFTAYHGFTIAWLGKRGIILDDDIKRIFTIIRKYK